MLLPGLPPTDGLQAANSASHEATVAARWSACTHTVRPCWSSSLTPNPRTGSVIRRSQVAGAVTSTCRFPKFRSWWRTPNFPWRIGS